MNKKLLLGIAALALAVTGGAVATGAVDNIVEDDPEVEIEDGVVLEPAETPEGDAYAELVNGDIEVEVDGLSQDATTRVSDVVVVSFDDDEAPEARVFIEGADASGENTVDIIVTGGNSVDKVGQPGTDVEEFEGEVIEGRENAVIIPDDDGSEAIIGFELESGVGNQDVLSGVTFVAEIPADFEVVAFEGESETVTEGETIELVAEVGNADVVEATRQLQIEEDGGDVSIEEDVTADADGTELRTFEIEAGTPDGESETRTFDLDVVDTGLIDRVEAVEEGDDRATDDSATAEVTVEEANPSLDVAADDTFGDATVAVVTFDTEEAFIAEELRYDLTFPADTDVGTVEDVEVEAFDPDAGDQTGVIEIAEDIDVEEFPDGEYELTAELIDDAGESFGDDAESSVTFEIDTDLPTVALEAVQAVGSEQRPVELAVDADDDNPGEADLEIIDPETDTVVFEADVDGAFVDPETVAWDTTGPDGAPVDDGEYVATVTAEDAFGNAVTTTQRVTVDNAAPNVEDVRPNTEVTNDEIQITANVDPGGDVATDVEAVELGIDADFADFRATETITPADETLSGTVTTTFAIDETQQLIPGTFDDGLPDGEYTAVAVATDGAGNEAEESGAGVTIDTESPVVRAQVDGLGDDPATLEIDTGGEAVSLTSVDITAIDEDDSEDPRGLDPANLPDGFDDEFEIEFDSSVPAGEETTFDIDVVAEDEAGNTDTADITSSVTPVRVIDEDDGVAEADPGGTDLRSEFDLAENDVSDGEGVGDVSATQTETAPQEVDPPADLATGDFVDIDPEVEEAFDEATVAIPLDSDAADVPGVAPEELAIFRSPDGSDELEPLPTRIEDGELRADIEEFSQFTPGGVADDPPVITDVDVDREFAGFATPEEEEELFDTTVTFEYEPADPALGSIDIGETSIDADVDEGRLDRQVTASSAEIEIDEVGADETVDVDIVVTDDRGNSETVTRTLNPVRTTGGGTGGGVVAGPPTPVPEGEAREAVDIEPGEPGTTVAIQQTALQTITFDDEVEGVVAVDELGELPGDLPNLGLDRPFVTGFEVAVPEEATNQQATLEIELDPEELEEAGIDPEELVVLRAVGDEFQTLDTEVVRTIDVVNIQAETPGFSVFVVTTADIDDEEPAVEEDPQPEPEEEPEPEPEPEPVPAEDQPGFGAVVAVTALLAAALLARRWHSD